ncbi:DUF5374 domain-containing protein [Bisgaardia hudsonensis]
MMNYNVSKYKGMSLLSLLMTLSLFSGIFLSINQWTSYQRKSAVEIYQHYQALQIAENQKQRLFLKLACQHRIIQNDLTFTIQCANKKVKVQYLNREVSL